MRFPFIQVSFRQQQCRNSLCWKIACRRLCEQYFFRKEKDDELFCVFHLYQEENLNKVALLHLHQYCIT